MGLVSSFSTMSNAAVTFVYSAVLHSSLRQRPSVKGRAPGMLPRAPVFLTDERSWHISLLYKSVSSAAK